MGIPRMTLGADRWVNTSEQSQLIVNGVLVAEVVRCQGWAGDEVREAAAPGWIGRSTRTLQLCSPTTRRTRGDAIVDVFRERENL
jgi:hypothetical protein